MDSIKESHTFIPGQIYAWAKVSRIHKTRNGIYQKNGRLISLLTDFGLINPCYPDTHGVNTDTILYTGSGRHGDQKLDPANRALLAAVDGDVEVRLFNKLSVNRWQFTGHWSVADAKYIFDEHQNRMLWKFTLTRTTGC